MTYRPGGSWLARRGRSTAFALVLSLLLHGGLLAGFYRVVLREESPAPRHIVPEARLASVTGALPPLESTPLRLAEQPLPRPAEPEQTPDELPLTTLELGEPLAAPPQPVDATPSPSAITAQALQAASTTGPVSQFFGQAGNAYKVVYVVDVSASLMYYMDDVTSELRRSIRSLVPTQRFHIVFACPQQVVEAEPRRLVPALGRYKASAMSFLDTVSGIPETGGADPIEAMRRAFAVEPELIYFLTDGDYGRIEENLEDELHKLNPDRRVKITVIGFNTSPRTEGLLKRIARRHEGHYRAVRMD